MALSLIAILNAPIIELGTIDSTNNYAMRLIDADTAQAGLTVTAQAQTHGKGQRGRQWNATPGESLLMSIIASPDRALREQFLYNACVATAVAGYVASLCENCQVHIKWPNDIIINDKKAGGMLLENVIRGSQWLYGVVGLGLNVLQESFTPELPHAISLRAATGKDFSIAEVGQGVRERILSALFTPLSARAIMDEYNKLLFKRGQQQAFSSETGSWNVKILGALSDGSLQVEKDKQILQYTHGAQEWVW